MNKELLRGLTQRRMVWPVRAVGAMFPSAVKCIRRMVDRPKHLNVNGLPKFLNHWLVSSAVLSFAVFLSVARAEDSHFSYTVTGNLKYEIQLPNGTTTILDRSYQIGVSNCMWHITVALQQEGFALMCDYDSTNLVCYGPTNVGLITGFIENVPVPSDWGAACVQHVWMAYASACYYQSLTNSEVYSFSLISGLRGHRLRYKETAKWTLHDQKPHLPSFIEMTSAGIRNVNAEGKLTLQNYGAPFEKGYTEGQYEVDSYTNVQNYTFPKTYNYRGYIIGNGSTTKCIVNVRGRTTSVAMGFVSRSLPDTVLLQDLRVPEPNVTYVNIGGRIPDINSLAVAEARSKSVPSSTGTVQTPAEKKSPAAIRWLLTILTVPILFLVWSMVKKKHKPLN